MAAFRHCTVRWREKQNLEIKRKRSICLIQGLEVEAFRAHPATLDSATHFGAVFDTDAGQPPRVPIALGTFTLPADCKASHQICIRI